jgi:hypothetical protein
MRQNIGLVFMSVLCLSNPFGSSEAQAGEAKNAQHSGEKIIEFKRGKSSTLPPETDVDALADQGQIETMRYAERREHLLRGLKSMRIFISEIRFQPETVEKIQYIEHTGLQDEAEKKLKAVGITRLPLGKHNPEEHPFFFPSDQTTLVITFVDTDKSKNSTFAKAEVHEPASLVRAPKLRTLATTWQMQKHAKSSTIQAARSKAVDVIITEFIKQFTESNSAGVVRGTK